MIGSTFLKLLPTAHLHLRRDLSLETRKNTYPVQRQWVDSLEAVGWRPIGPKTTKNSCLNPIEAVGWQLEVLGWNLQDQKQQEIAV